MSVVGGARTELEAAWVSHRAPSARNLLVTVFGDAIAAHDLATAVSVRSLTALVSPFGVNERLVRTSLTRLVQNELLAVHPVGRRSFYSVAPESVALFSASDERIYRGTVPAWDGLWTIVVIDGNDGTPSVRTDLRADLVERGFSTIAPNVLVSALTTPDDIADVVTEAVIDRILVTRAATVTFGRHGVDRRLALDAYPIRERAEAYDEFIERFSPFANGAVATFEPEEAFKLRILLLAHFRRIVLTDAALPREILPSDWIGDTARTLAAEVYGQCATGSESFLNAVIETPTGTFAPLSIDLATRFAATPPVSART